MILEKELSINITNRNVKYYKELGYNTIVGNSCNISNEDVNDSSHIIESRQCDECGVVYSKTHQCHIRTFNIFNRDLCPHCAKNSDETLKKRKITCNEKYGVDNVNQNKQIKSKKLLTNMKKYGVANPMQDPEIYQKMTHTCEERYGNNYREEFAKKTKETCVNRYGVVNIGQLEETKEKVKNTCISKYGVDNVFKSEEIKEQIKNTNIEKYGVENPLSNHEVRRKCSLTLYSEGKVAVSSQQKNIYQILLDNFPEYNIILNYPIDKYFLDICIEELGIDIEYDGNYWHINRQDQDNIRDNIILQNNYKILRIKSDRNIPTDDQLFKAIDNLINSNKQIETLIV